MVDQRSGKSRNLGLLFLAALLLTLAAIMAGVTSCAGRYEYSMDRAIDPPKNGEFGSSTDIRKYCDEQKNDLLCKEALARGRLKEKSSGWGLLPLGPMVSPYPYDYLYRGSYYPVRTFPPCIYYNPRDLVGHPECGWIPPTTTTPKTEQKNKEDSP